jgi:hypothetical protein
MMSWDDTGNRKIDRIMKTELVSMNVTKYLGRLEWAKEERITRLKEIYLEKNGVPATKENLYVSLLYDKDFNHYIAREVLGDVV